MKLNTITFKNNIKQMGVAASVFALTAFTMPSFAADLPQMPAMPTLPTAATGQFAPVPPEVHAKSYIVMDADTGKILTSMNADQKLPPASTTKIMTMYIIANALAHKQIGPNDMVTISEKAWRMDGSRMFVKVGDKVPVHQLIQGIVVASGNDASVAMAEFLAGSEESFAGVMNQQAQLLGMKNSHFTDSTGMPDPNHYTTAYDLAKVAQATIKYFPKQYAIYSQKSFLFNNINQPNRNQLLWRDESVDGLKTGHTDEAGYCLVASAKRGDMRLISVIMGAPNDKTRTEDTQRLLNFGFRFFETAKLVQPGKVIRTEQVWYGDKEKVTLGVAQPIALTLPRGQLANMKLNLQIETPIEAPIAKGQKLGTLQIVKNNKVLVASPLVALHSVAKGGLFSRMKDSVSLRMARWFGSEEGSSNSNVKKA